MDSLPDMDSPQGLIEESARRAGRAMRENFVHPDWIMSAEEFEAFWSRGPMAAFCTASASGAPHVVPIDPVYEAGVFTMPTFRDAARLRDLRADPRVAIASWDGPYRAVVVYGRAEIDDAGEGRMVVVRVVPERIYAIRPPAGHPAAP